MIDFHTHILPGIDDGSRNLEESEAMLCEEARQGVSTVVATPHFYAHHVSIGAFLERRQAAYEKVCALKERHSLPDVLRAAEVYFFPGMGRAQQLPQLCVEGTKLLLLEMPFNQWTTLVYNEVKEIVEKQKLDVMLVHLERFLPYQKDKACFEAVMDLPVTVQINAGSLLEWRSRRLDKKILKMGKPVVLGSDCHNMSHRPPNLEQGRAVLAKKMGEELLREMDATAEGLLKNQAAAVRLLR